MERIESESEEKLAQGADAGQLRLTHVVPISGTLWSMRGEGRCGSGEEERSERRGVGKLREARREGGKGGEERRAVGLQHCIVVVV